MAISRIHAASHDPAWRALIDAAANCTGVAAGALSAAMGHKARTVAWAAR